MVHNSSLSLYLQIWDNTYMCTKEEATSGIEEAKAYC